MAGYNSWHHSDLGALASFVHVDGRASEPSDFQRLSTGVCHEPPFGTTPFHRVRLPEPVHLLSQEVLVKSSVRELGE